MEALPNYAERFVVRPAAFDQGRRGAIPTTGSRRCGRRSATERAESGWSILGGAVTAGDAGVVGALLEASGRDPAAMAAETPEEALLREAERGLFPVHREPLEQLAAEAASRRSARRP